MDNKEHLSNFLTDIIDADLAAGRVTEIITRFPPEPNGYIHIGSAKAICINYLTALQYNGRYNLRFDDTNPTKEEHEFVESIIRDIEWLGFPLDGRVLYASDYFPQCYEYALVLIRKGLAFIDELTADELREYRGTLTEPGRESPYRNRPIAENERLFVEMKEGKHPDGSKVLRARIDMGSPNMNMRDPVIYRILHATHYRQGDEWCIYPMYDFAHPIQDAIEGITHSMCSLEFEDHRPLYDWVINNIGIPEDKKPHQYEFSRLNVCGTVTGKRHLIRLVNEGWVDGWDDPRMPTLTGLRRRGYTPSSIRRFVVMAGVSKVNSVVDSAMLEHCIRDELNATAKRVMAVLHPLKVTLTNYHETQEFMSVCDNPEAESPTYRKVPFSNVIYIEQGDFMAEPPPKYFRLKPGGEVRLIGAYIIRCDDVVYDDAGNVVELLCSIDPDSRGGNAPDGRKIKGTIHWVSAAHAIKRDVYLYENLISNEEAEDLADRLHPNSCTILRDCMCEPSLEMATPDERYQFMRNGYFVLDTKHPKSFNRIVTLKDSWKPPQN